MNVRKVQFVTLSPESRPFLNDKEWAHNLMKRNPPAVNLGGLVNLGNSCFMNSVLQCLAYTPGFKFFADHIPNEVLSYHLGKPFFLYHFSLLAQSLAVLPSTAPHVFFHNLRMICPDMEQGNQQDAHEYLLALLNKFDEEMHVMNNFDKNTPHSIFSFFGGMLSQILSCSHCNNKDESKQYFLDLSLHLGGETIEDCFLQFITPKLIEDFSCRHCEKKGTVTKQILVADPPNILIVTLMRFSPEGLKLNKNIHFDFTLELTNCCESKNEKVEYELYAMINHTGNQISRGHFSSFVQNGLGLWLNVDDCKVLSETIESALHCKPYVLFYKRNFPRRIAPIMCNFTASAVHQTN